MERYICIHGHFYQPPRENAWLEHVELQDSAYPYHDWNDRINSECYETNNHARILDGDGYISSIVSNYSRISYNFGPTLLSWMKQAVPDDYRAILDTDLPSRERFSGHGSALAQAYNHMIMPLANHRDRYTQVYWGIRDFESRFERYPEGMWLPETAVDMETLEILAERGIKFTILAPHQAKRVRKLNTARWADVSNASIDPTRAYLARLPSGRSINIFFYDGPISRGIAFEDTLNSGETFAKRLVEAFSDKRAEAQLVHIATDGETYGHHHSFGDMALAYALDYIEKHNLAKITNYGEFLEKYPPTHEVEIIEKTSWSCMHGVERWWKDCGDNTGGHPGWNQAWRTPLREALDWLRDTLTERYQEKAGEYLKDPWTARDDYIDVILNRGADNYAAFLGKHAAMQLNDDEQVTVLKLLELQRHAMLMYTSCGWFFDDLSGIETVQVIQYAGRVVQLAGELFGNNTEEQFLQLLEKAVSNIPEQGNGRQIYERYVKPAMVDLDKVVAHYAINSLFEEYDNHVKIYCYGIDVEDYQTSECGKTRLVVGRCRVTSEITRETALRDFGVIHFGGHVINAGVSEIRSDEAYHIMVDETARACSIGDFADLVRLLDRHFNNSSFSLKTLFRDEQRKVLGHILESTMADIESSYRQLYETNTPLMLYLAELGGPVPRAFHAAAELILNIDLHRAVSGDVIEADTVRTLVSTAKSWQVDLDIAGISYDLQANMERIAAAFSDSPQNSELLLELIEAAGIVRDMPFSVNLWKVQNLFWEMLQTHYPEISREAVQGDTMAGGWVNLFKELGDHLKIRVI